MLKLKVTQECGEPCQQAFKKLKNKLYLLHVLKFPIFDLPFEMHTDAIDFAIGRVLIQDGEPIAYKSLKLNNCQKSRPINEELFLP